MTGNIIRDLKLKAYNQTFTGVLELDSVEIEDLSDVLRRADNTAEEITSLIGDALEELENAIGVQNTIDEKTESILELIQESIIPDN